MTLKSTSEKVVCVCASQPTSVHACRHLYLYYIHAQSTRLSFQFSNFTWQQLCIDLCTIALIYTTVCLISSKANCSTVWITGFIHKYFYSLFIPRKSFLMKFSTRIFSDSLYYMKFIVEVYFSHKKYILTVDYTNALQIPN